MYKRNLHTQVSESTEKLDYAMKIIACLIRHPFKVFKLTNLVQKTPNRWLYNVILNVSSG